MKKVILSCIILVMVLGIFANVRDRAIVFATDTEIIVNHTFSDSLNTSQHWFNLMSQAYKINKLYDIYDIQDTNTTRYCYLMEYKDSLDMEQLILDFVSKNNVLNAHPDYLVELDGNNKSPEQWYLNKIGMDLVASNYTMTGTNQKIAVIDSGIDLGADHTTDIVHPDLIQNIYTSPTGSHGYNCLHIIGVSSVYAWDDPLTYIDSCYAVIDIGFTILESSSRARSKYPRLNPESLQSHIAISNKLLESIYNNEPILFEDYTHAEKPTMLYNNYPNPFNPSTTISFYNNKDCDVKLKVYNVRGQLVKTLLNEHTEAGNHNITWHGRNNNNQKVASGVYFYRLKTDSKTLTKKCLLLK